MELYNPIATVQPGILDPLRTVQPGQSVVYTYTHLTPAGKVRNQQIQLLRTDVDEQCMFAALESRNLIAFCSGTEHGVWYLDSNGKLHIKFRYNGDEETAYWHTFTKYISPLQTGTPTFWHASKTESSEPGWHNIYLTDPTLKTNDDFLIL